MTSFQFLAALVSGRNGLVEIDRQTAVGGPEGPVRVGVHRQLAHRIRSPEGEGGGHPDGRVPFRSVRRGIRGGSRADVGDGHVPFLDLEGERAAVVGADPEVFRGLQEDPEVVPPRVPVSIQLEIEDVPVLTGGDECGIPGSLPQVRLPVHPVDPEADGQDLVHLERDRRVYDDRLKVDLRDLVPEDARVVVFVLLPQAERGKDPDAVGEIPVRGGLRVIRVGDE